MTSVLTAAQQEEEEGIPTFSSDLLRSVLTERLDSSSPDFLLSLKQFHDSDKMADLHYLTDLHQSV